MSPLLSPSVSLLPVTPFRFPGSVIRSVVAVRCVHRSGYLGYDLAQLITLEPPCVIRDRVFIFYFSWVRDLENDHAFGRLVSLKQSTGLYGRRCDNGIGH